MLSLTPLDTATTTTKKPKQPPDSPQKLRPNSLNSFLHNNPRTCLLAAILALQFVLLLLNIRSLPFSHRGHVASSSAATSLADPCDSGRVFVYELPESMNRAVLAGLDANAMSNSGFGPPARGLSGIIPARLADSWFRTDQFSTEVIFHNRMMSHRCRVWDPQNATSFYVPFYAGLALGKHLWKETSTAEDKDGDCQEMLTWLQSQPYYIKSGGWDHFIAMSRISWDFRRSKNRDGAWGSSCIYLPGMRNLTRLLIERNPWDYFDVGVPYPTGLHPKTAEDLAGWQAFVRDRRRDALFCFAGAARGAFREDFRGKLLRHCADESETCLAVDCSGTKCANDSTAVLEAFLGSEFCLQPRGDSFTRRSIFDCMVAGAIPVFFWHRTAYWQYEWFLPSEPESYSVYIDRNAVKNGTVSVKEVLESYSPEKKRKMREKVIEYIPRMVYSQPTQGLGTVKDAFDVALDGVFRRFKDHQKEGFKW